MKKIVFDLDETLGTIITDGYAITGFNIRTGCIELLEQLKQSGYRLALWTVSTRGYAEKALAYGLKSYFSEIYTWDDIQCDWKDIRKIKADYLVDDSDFYLEQACKHNLADHYILVPAYGSTQEIAEPLAWVNQIKTKLGL